MKKFNHLFAFAIALLFLPFLQSCNDDDDVVPTPITYPHTIAFSHFENIDFKMWKTGAEVSTTGLDFIDFVEDEEDAYELSSEFYEARPGVTFTEDSVFSLAEDGTIKGYPYFIENDTIFAEISFYLGSDTGYAIAILGMGSPSHVRVTQGFAQYCDLYNNGTEASCATSLLRIFQTFESASENLDILSLDNIEEGDTLIINNRYVHYQ